MKTEVTLGLSVDTSDDGPLVHRATVCGANVRIVRRTLIARFDDVVAARSWLHEELLQRPMDGIRWLNMRVE